LQSLALVQRRPVRLFDIGAGDCRRFDATASVGPFSFHGVELNGRMAARACEAGYDVTHSAFEDYDSGERAGTMDVVIINHVIEHVLDPEDTLRKAYRLLSDGGILYGRTPKLDGVDRRLFGRYWGGYHFPRHVELFPRAA